MSNHQHARHSSRTRLALLFGLCAGLLPIGRTTAQGPDTAREIQELAKRIDDQLKEIDRLLLESAKKDQVRSKPKELLQQSVDRSKDVGTSIEELIEKLQEMKNQSSSSSQSDDPSQDQNQPKDQQDQKPGEGQKPGQQKRRDNQTPDFVRQPQQGEGEPKPGEGQPKPGEGQPKPEQQPDQQTGKECEKPGEGDPKGGKGDKTPGQNTAGKAPPDGETGPGAPGQGSESWGELQGYLNELKNRGSAPKVPEKYRKYWEAYLKQKQGSGGGGSGSSGTGGGGGK